MNANRRRPRYFSRQSASFAQRRRKRALLGVIAGAVAIVSWIFVLSRSSYLTTLSIDTISVYGAGPDVTAPAGAAAWKALNGAYLGILSRSNSLIYPSRAVESAVVSSSPAVGAVSVRLNGLHELIISISEKAPAAVVCPSLPDFSESGLLRAEPSSSCYFADENGYIFKDASSSQESGYLRLYAPNLPADPIGLNATTTAEFKQMMSFAAGMDSAGLGPRAMLMKPGGEFEFYVPTAASSSAGSEAIMIVYANDEGGLSAELPNLLAFWNRMAAGANGAAGAPYAYIDLRYGSNVYYQPEAPSNAE